MNCKNCGNELKEGAKFCAACGTAVEAAPVEPIAEPVVEATPVAPAEPVAPVVEPVVVTPPVAAPYVPPVTSSVATPKYKDAKKKKVTEEDLPDHLRPLSPWAYFGLSLLYSVPIVGFIFLIIFSISRANINRRNFTRSYWCSLIIVGVILLIALVIAIITGAEIFSMRAMGGGAQMVGGF